MPKCSQNLCHSLVGLLLQQRKKHQQLNEMSIVLWYFNVHLYCKQNVVDDHKRSKYPRINDSCIQMNIVAVLTAMLI